MVNAKPGDSVVGFLVRIILQVMDKKMWVGVVVTLKNSFSRLSFISQTELFNNHYFLYKYNSNIPLLLKNPKCIRAKSQK